MADAKQNNDDLIILSDDVETDSSDMVINLDEAEVKEDDTILTFDEPEENTQSKDDSFTIDFDSDKKTSDIKTNESTINADDLTLEDLTFPDTEDEPTLETTPKDKTEPSVELNFLDEKADTVDADNKKTQEKNTTEETMNFDTPTEKDVEKDNTVVENTSDLNLGTMENILEDTIHKLEKRQEVIDSEEEKEMSNIDTLNEKIKKLEDEKLDAETRKTELEKEENQIKTNITQLTKMKSSTAQKTVTKSKK